MLFDELRDLLAYLMVVPEIITNFGIRRSHATITMQNTVQVAKPKCAFCWMSDVIRLLEYSDFIASSQIANSDKFLTRFL